MFSGYGLYKNGKIFGMILGDKLYFKVGENNKKKYEDAGSNPFAYQHKSGKKVMTSYYEVPEYILENKDELASWMTDSLQVKR